MKKFIKGLFFGAAAGTIGGLLAAPRSGKETRQHLINELEDYRSLKNQVTNDWDQVQRNLAVVEENVPLATEFSKDLQQEITDFKFGLLKLKNKLPKSRLNYLTHKPTSKSKVFYVNYFFCY